MWPFCETDANCVRDWLHLISPLAFERTPDEDRPIDHELGIEVLARDREAIATENGVTVANCGFFIRFDPIDGKGHGL